MKPIIVLTLSSNIAENRWLVVGKILFGPVLVKYSSNALY